MIDKEKIIKELAITNKFEYNLLKACEELSELSEVLLKRLLKDKHERCPTDKSIIEEIGDVKIRIDILTKIYGEEAVDARVDEKLNKYEQYIKENKYIGSI